MTEYHKINSLFKRDQKGKLLMGEFSRPEFEYLKNNIWVFTEKLDGTNIRLIWQNNQLEIKGKTDKAQLPQALVNTINTKNLPEKFTEVFSSGTPMPVVVYCEGIGEKIQNGGDYCSGNDIVTFDIKVGSWWLMRKDVIEISEKLNLRTVPVCGEGTLEDLIYYVKAGFYSEIAKKHRDAEGIVARPLVELRARNGERIITKLKTKDFE